MHVHFGGWGGRERKESEKWKELVERGEREGEREKRRENLLLLTPPSCLTQVKLSDFGMARVLDDNSEVYNLSNLGARIPIAW